MDLQQIYAALQSTLAKEATERDAAEVTLKSFEGQPSYMSSLFRVVNSEGVALQVRQAGIIYFKNLVGKHWEREEPADEDGYRWVIAEEERTFIRSTLLEALIAAHPLCRQQVAESLRKITNLDFPDKMPDLLGQIAERLDVSLPPEQIKAALTALRVLTKNYEYKSAERRKALNEILSATFTRVQAVMEATLTAPLGDEVAAEMQKIMIKAMWSSCHSSLPLYLQNGEIFMSWMSLMYRVIQAPVPPSAVGKPGEDNKEMDKMVFWKCKRRAAQILHRLFQKYGNKKIAEKQFGEERAGEVAISVAFHDQLASRFLQMFMQELAKIGQGQVLPERFVVEAINYIQIAITLSITWKDLQPNCMALVSHVLFPMLCFDQNDQELWEDDPQEFVRKAYDIMEDFTSQRVAACNLINDLCKKRTKTALLPTLEMCVGHISAYAAAPPGQGDASKRDGALYCIGSLSGPLQEKKVAEQFGQQLHWLLTSHVVLDFKSPVGHLRSRAAWVVAQMVDTIALDPAFFQVVVTEVMNLLNDPAFPVRFQAAVALRSLIYDQENAKPREAIAELVGAVLQPLMQKLFDLMDEIGSDELISTLEVLIEAFDDKMGPFALDLCRRLADHFLKLANPGDEGGGNSEEDEESRFAATQCCSAITTLLESIKKTPELYHTLEPALVPMLGQVLSPNGKDGDYDFMEFMEDALEILTYLTYYTPAISDAVWSLFAPLCQSFHDWAFDYLQNINLPLDNFISRANERFVSNPAHVQTVYSIIEKVLGETEVAERDIVEACKLAESLVLNCIGRIDMVISSLLGLIVNRFRNTPPVKAFCRTELLKQVANCLYYNAQGTLASLEQLGATESIMQTWLQALNDSTEVEIDDTGGKASVKTHFKGTHDMKVCILGLSSILRVPFASLPPSVAAGLPQIISALLALESEFDVANKQREANEAEDDDDDGDDDDEDGILDVDDDLDEGDNDDDREDIDSVLMKLSQLREGGGTWDDLFADEEDEDSDCTSPIDDVDEVIFFVEALLALQAANPEQAAGVTAALSPEQQQLMQALITHAPQRAQENIAKKAAAEAEKAAGGASG